MDSILETQYITKARLVSQTFIDGNGSARTRLVRDTALFDDGLYFVQKELMDLL